MTLREKIAKVVKDTCHFAVEDGKCGVFDKCPEAECFYAIDQLNQIITLFRKEVEGIVREVYATTINPNPAFQDGSQEQFWMQRCYKLQEAIQALLELVKEEKLEAQDE